MSNVGSWIPGLGPLESAIMTVIWDADQSLSVRVVRERMDYLAADGEDPAYTTVMSVMVILWRKGFLDRAKCPGAGSRESLVVRGPHQPRRPSRHRHPSSTYLRTQPRGRPAPSHPVDAEMSRPALTMPGHRG